MENKDMPRWNRFLEAYKASRHMCKGNEEKRKERANTEPTGHDEEGT